MNPTILTTEQPTCNRSASNQILTSSELEGCGPLGEHIARGSQKAVAITNGCDVMTGSQPEHPWAQCFMSITYVCFSGFHKEFGS